MKSKPEYVEGPQAFTQFQDAMKRVLAVPHTEIQQRIEAERKRSLANPNRRGPKPKVKIPRPSATEQGALPTASRH